MGKYTEEEKLIRKRAADKRTARKRSAMKRLGNVRLRVEFDMVNKAGERVEIRANYRTNYETTYAAWVIPLVGDPIQVGPFKSPFVTFTARYRIVRKLVEQNNARPLDVRLLGMYDRGELFVDP